MIVESIFLKSQASLYYLELSPNLVLKMGSSTNATIVENGVKTGCCNQLGKHLTKYRDKYPPKFESTLSLQ